MRAGNIARNVSSPINNKHTISLWSHEAALSLDSVAWRGVNNFHWSKKRWKIFFAILLKHKENSRRTRSLSWVVGPQGEDKQFLNSFINISWLRLTCGSCTRLYLDSEKAEGDSGLWWTGSCRIRRQCGPTRARGETCVFDGNLTININRLMAVLVDLIFDSTFQSEHA